CCSVRASDADTKVRSSDGTLFKVHQRTVNKYSDGLVEERVPNARGELELEEDSETLCLLFQFMYKKKPDIASLAFSTLRKLSEAAETYQVDPHSDTCDYHMRLHCREHPLDVLAYALKRNLTDVVDEAAPRTVGLDIETAFQALGKVTFVPWIFYREQWIDIMRTVNDPPEILHKGGSRSCELWHGFYMNVVRDLRGFGPGEVQDGSRVFNRYRGSLKNCHHCKIRADNWMGKFMLTPEKIPKFSTVLAEMS
ncbi:hypothetical protein FOMPIDRAFT_1120746, partial [Fomitopsis schrenkii]